MTLISKLKWHLWSKWRPHNRKLKKLDNYLKWATVDSTGADISHLYGCGFIDTSGELIDTTGNTIHSIPVDSSSQLFYRRKKEIEEGVECLRRLAESARKENEELFLRNDII
jgi:hypothetical protein